MKTLKCFLVLFSFLGLMFVGFSDESQSPVSQVDQGSLAKNVIHKFVVYDNPLPPTGDPMQGVKILPNGNIQFKKKVVNEDIKAYKLDDDGNETSEVDPFITALMTHFLSTMINGETGNGPVHGSFTSDPVDDAIAGPDAVWIGSYTGYRSLSVGYDDDNDGKYDRGEWILKLKLEAHGKGGIIHGWQFFTESTLTIYNYGPILGMPILNFPFPQAWFGKGYGFYKEH